MRILVQRVSSASVTVDGKKVGVIEPDGQGLLALVGVTHDDDSDKARRLAEKLWQLRILDDEKSAADVEGSGIANWGEPDFKYAWAPTGAS